MCSESEVIFNDALPVLLWATGFLQRLPHPDQIIDAGRLGDIFRKNGPDGLRKKARLRPQSKLLDAADLAYRMNWAAVNARVTGQSPPPGLHPGIAYERHYAFNWLYGHMGLSWGPTTGRMIADMMTRGSSNTNPAPFCIDRQM